MNTREQAIAYISGAIATYSLRKERGELEDQASMYDFLAKTNKFLRISMRIVEIPKNSYEHRRKSLRAS